MTYIRRFICSGYTAIAHRRIALCLALGLCLSAILTVAGCVVDTETARRTADGSQKRGEKQDASESSSSQRDRDLYLTITPGPVNIDPDLWPEAPDKNPALIAMQSMADSVAQNAPAWRPPLLSPMLQPQTITVVDGDRSYTLPVFPGAKIKMQSTESNADAKASSTSSELTTSEAWKAVRHAPAAVWYIAAAGLLLSLIPLFVSGYRWLCPVIAGGTTLATVTFVLAYSQGQTLAYALTGMLAAGALFAMLIIWLTLRGKLRMQNAILDITSGIELAKKSITAAAAQTTDATAMAALNQARSVVTTSLGVEQNDSTKALVAKIKSGSL